MKVDFDNLRKRIGNQYNALYLLCNQIKNFELKSPMVGILGHMHDSIATLLCCKSDNEKINAVEFDLLPNDKDKEEDE